MITRLEQVCLGVYALMSFVAVSSMLVVVIAGAI